MRAPDYHKIWVEFHALKAQRPSPERAARLELMARAYPLLLSTRGDTKPHPKAPASAIEQRLVRREMMGTT